MASWRGIPITQGPDGQYHAKVTVGRKPNGRPDRRHRAGPTVEAVKTKLQKLMAEVDAGRTPRPGRVPTVEEWFTQWLTDIAPVGARALAPRTLDDYWSKCRTWVFPHVGGHRLDALETDHLDAMYTAMREASSWRGSVGGRAPSTLLKVHAIVRRGLEVAVRRGRVGRNVARMMDPPGYGEPARESLTRDESRRVLRVVVELRGGVRWLVGLAIGPRQGETLGLRWEDLDLDEGVVSIQWQLQRRPFRHGCTPPCGRKRGAECPQRMLEVRRGEMHLDGGLVLCRPKGWRRRPRPRVVKLPAPLVVALRAHRAMQRKEQLRAGTAWAGHQLVFAREDGRPVDPRQDYQQWQGVLAAAGLPPARVHVARHTTATVLLDMGEDLSVIQEVLGHADPRTTRGYQDVTVAMTGRAADRMEEALWGSVTDLVTGRENRQPKQQQKPRGNRRVDEGLRGLSRLSESNRRPTHYESVEDGECV